jgi:hypothetical protein
MYHSQASISHWRLEGQYIQTKCTEDRMNGVATLTQDQEKYPRSKLRMLIQSIGEHRHRLDNEASSRRQPNPGHDENMRECYIDLYKVKDKMTMLGLVEHCEMFEEDAEREEESPYRWGL